MLQALMSGAAFNLDWFLAGLIPGYRLHPSVRCVVSTPLNDLTARFLQLTCITINNISQPIEATSQNALSGVANPPKVLFLHPLALRPCDWDVSNMAGNDPQH